MGGPLHPPLPEEPSSLPKSGPVKQTRRRQRRPLSPEPSHLPSRWGSAQTGTDKSPSPCSGPARAQLGVSSKASPTTPSRKTRQALSAPTRACSTRCGRPPPHRASRSRHPDRRPLRSPSCSPLAEHLWAQPHCVFPQSSRNAAYVPPPSPSSPCNFPPMKCRCPCLATLRDAKKTTSAR